MIFQNNTTNIPKKKIYKTKKGLICWIQLHKIRWIERNVITQQLKKVQRLKKQRKNRRYIKTILDSG